MSKEEILQRLSTTKHDVEYQMFSYNDVQKAMSEYAEQEAIAFRLWCHLNEFDERTRNAAANNPELTTEQLYNLFKQKQ